MNKNLKDANLAGGARSRECTLIVGEGDSANKLALAGISAAPGGNDTFGTFKLKGKPINIMKLTKVEAVKNEVRPRVSNAASRTSRGTQPPAQSLNARHPLARRRLETS